MKILLPLLPDPTDVVVQNEMTSFSGGRLCPYCESVQVQGELTIEKLTGFPVPRAMIGQHEWYGLLPRKLAPMRVAGGEIVFMDVGAGPKQVFIDSTQAWLNSQVKIDSTGALDAVNCPDIIGPAEATWSFTVAADDMLDDTDKIVLPRKALAISNLSGKRYFPVLPESYFQREMVNATMVQDTLEYVITGQTLDSTGAPLGDCRVVLIDTARIIAGGAINPIVAETVSDGVGNYSIVAPRPVDFQLIAYKPGSPDVAGITRDDVFPAVNYA